MLKLSDTELAAFVSASNAIEGIKETSAADLAAHKYFLALPEINVVDLDYFVKQVQPNARLRLRPQDTCTVGSHVPPAGGQAILYKLQNLLEPLRQCANAVLPYTLHCEYLTLHPFTDGNGRSARALYAWHCNRAGRDGYIRRGFLHEWYYESLRNADGRQ